MLNGIFCCRVDTFVTRIRLLSRMTSEVNFEIILSQKPFAAAVLTFVQLLTSVNLQAFLETLVN